MPKGSKISVLLVDDIQDTRDNLQKLLFFERDIEVVGTASNGQEALDFARRNSPDVMVMDITMPVMGGVEAAEAIRAQGIGTQVIMMSVWDDQDSLRRSMLAGARDYLVKPFSGEELATAIRRVYERADRALLGAKPAAAEPAASLVQGRVFTVFGPKGGVGRTTIAVNLAVALRQVTNRSVAIVDGNLAFGDVGILLNLQPTKTIIDVLPHIAGLEADLLRELVVTHQQSGVDVLLAPPRPEMAELVAADVLKQIVTKMTEAYEYVVVDTAPSFHDTSLAVLDLAEKILVLLTLEMPSIKNGRLFLELAQLLGYPREKLMLVLNRATSPGGIKPQDVESGFNQTLAERIPTDAEAATTALNQGIPVVLSSRTSPMSRAITDLARSIAGLSVDESARQSVLSGIAAQTGGVSSRNPLKWFGRGKEVTSVS